MSLYLAVFGKPRYLGLVNIGDPVPKAGEWIVVRTVRGTEMALLGGSLSQEQETKYRTACFEEPNDEHTRGPEPMLQEVEFAGPAEGTQIEEYLRRRSDEEGVLVRSRQILRNHELLMKLVDVEYTMDRKKLFFYFTSEQRIDFRAYVRDLAKEFRIRIEMRQIGVRDEAKTVRGVSPCGRPCCCSYWLHRFTPINIRMVKEQNLALNPTKISGICGRLMCCMAYEHPTYSDLWRSLPSPGSKIKAAQGNYTLEGVDLRTESVSIRLPDGQALSVPIAEFANFRDTVLRNEEWKSAAQEEPHPAPFSSSSASSRGVHRGLEASRDIAGKSKKFKAEKISIEEHIAGRVAESEKPRELTKAEILTRPEAAGKKRPRKRKTKAPAETAREPAKEAAREATKIFDPAERFAPQAKQTEQKGLPQQRKERPVFAQPRFPQQNQPPSAAPGSSQAERSRRSRFRGGKQGRGDSSGINGINDTKES